MSTVEDGILVLDECNSLMIMLILDFLIEVLNVRFYVFIITEEITKKNFL
jgi:hypothetical protein